MLVVILIWKLSSYMTSSIWTLDTILWVKDVVHMPPLNIQFRPQINIWTWWFSAALPMCSFVAVRAVPLLAPTYSIRKRGKLWPSIVENWFMIRCLICQLRIIHNHHHGGLVNIAQFGAWALVAITMAAVELLFSNAWRSRSHGVNPAAYHLEYTSNSWMVSVLLAVNCLQWIDPKQAPDWR